MQRGFTLIEIVVVIGILAVLLSLGLFMSMETLRGTIYRSEAATIVSLLQKARSRGMANIEQSPWSVCYVNTQYVVAKGALCNAATAHDVVAANPGVAAASSFADPAKFPTIVFAQLSGNTTATSITVLQDSRTQTIAITHEGTIIW